jgi:hypothetical protein
MHICVSRISLIFSLSDSDSNVEANSLPPGGKQKHTLTFSYHYYSYLLQLLLL